MLTAADTEFSIPQNKRMVESSSSTLLPRKISPRNTTNYIIATQNTRGSSNWWLFDNSKEEEGAVNVNLEPRGGDRLKSGYSTDTDGYMQPSLNVPPMFYKSPSLTPSATYKTSSLNRNTIGTFHQFEFVKAKSMPNEYSQPPPTTTITTSSTSTTNDCNSTMDYHSGHSTILGRGCGPSLSKKKKKKTKDYFKCVTRMREARKVHHTT